MKKILLLIGILSAYNGWTQTKVCPANDFLTYGNFDYTCLGSETEFFVYGVTPITATWDFGDGTSKDGEEGTIQFGPSIYDFIIGQKATHLYNDNKRQYSGKITITVTPESQSSTYPSGYTCYIPFFANIVSPPIIEEAINCAGKDTKFIVTDNSISTITGNIDFGDGSSSPIAARGQYTVHNYGNTGSYTVVANVTSSFQVGDKISYQCPATVSEVFAIPSCTNFVCENTDLETGDFTRWKTWTNSGGCSFSDNSCFKQGPIANEHEIVSGSGVDEYGGFPKVASGGKYSLKIGNDSRDNFDSYQAAYFPRDITAENSIFAYRIAAVIEVPDEDLFLTYNVRPNIRLALSTNFESFNSCSELDISPDMLTGLKKIPGTNLYYLSWTTQFFDLTSFIGEKLYISVEARKGNYNGKDEINHNLIAYLYFDSYCMPPTLQPNSACKANPVQFSTPFETVFSSDYNITWDMGDGSGALVGSTVNHTFTTPGTYQVTMTYNPPDLNPFMGEPTDGINCGGIKLTQSVVVSECTPPNFVCEDCIPTFSPLPGQKYILQAWVKEGNGIGRHTYEKPGIRINFSQGTITEYFKPAGLIIDGWQRIEGEFVVPLDAKEIQVELHNNDNNIEVFFDDIRVQPFNASMKAFVFDPVTLRLVAELDERNYATFFEYDEEGTLVRSKKETERGVKTLSEARASMIKRKPKP